MFFDSTKQDHQPEIPVHDKSSQQTSYTHVEPNLNLLSYPLQNPKSDWNHNKCKTVKFPGHVELSPPPISVDEGEEVKYEVEDILDVKRVHNKSKYLVSWHGYGPEENSWEPLVNLDNAKDTLVLFHCHFPMKPQPASLADDLA